MAEADVRNGPVTVGTCPSLARAQGARCADLRSAFGLDLLAHTGCIWGLRRREGEGGALPTEALSAQMEPAHQTR